MKDCAVSVVIITKNQRTFLERSLPMVRAQRGLAGAAEIIVVDCGSTDGAPQYARSQGACVVSLAPERFGYARAHNVGAARANAPFVVRLSGDAVPAGTNWLRELIAPLRASENAAAAWGRQILPADVCNPVERFHEQVLRPGAQGEWRHYKDPVSVLGSNMACRRALWEAYPFDEQLPQAEDYDWLCHWQRRGKKGVYVPAATILHSHKESIGRALRRSLAQSAIQGLVLTGLKTVVFRGRRTAD